MGTATLRDERANLKAARAPNPTIERHVVGDEGHGLHHADSWPCQQKSGGERVEEGQERVSERRHSNVVSAKFGVNQNASVSGAGPAKRTLACWTPPVSQRERVSKS